MRAQSQTSLFNQMLGSDIARRFQKRFDNIKAVHNFDIGDEFESALAEVLREVLPDRFGVCRGFVV